MSWAAVFLHYLGGFFWHRECPGIGALKIRRLETVMTGEWTPEGWLSRVSVCFDLPEPWVNQVTPPLRSWAA